MLEKLYKLVEMAPTTNMRILLTLGIVLGTAIKYWVSSGWIPDIQWLVFLAGMAGLDVWQHYNKRVTSWAPTELASAEMIRKNGIDNETDEEIG